MIYNFGTKSKPIVSNFDQYASNSMPPSQQIPRDSDSALQREDADAENFGAVPARSANAITARLRHAIETGVFSDGDQLPPERQLAVALGTARSTIRKALDQLEQKSLVVRRVGSGTFVNYSGPLQSTAGDVADLISPLQLIETRMAIEPYMTKLAVIHATEKDLDSIEASLKLLEAAATDQDRFTRVGRRVSSATGALCPQSAHSAHLPGNQRGAGSRPVGTDEEDNSHAGKNRLLQRAAPGNSRCLANPQRRRGGQPHQQASRNRPAGSARRRRRLG